MPALPFGVSINVSPLDDDNDACFANALDQARQWHEVLRSDGSYWRDTLAHPRVTGTQTGLPGQLDAGVAARTYCSIRRPGVWHVIWDGQAEVLAVNGSSRGEGSTMGSPGVQGHFTFTADPTNGYAQITIALTNAADSIRNFRVVHSTDVAGNAWQGFSAGFVARMNALRPEWLRLLGWFKVNNGTGEFPTLWSQRRSDTYWTQSDTALDVFTVSGASWSGAAPTNGQTIEYRNAGNSVVASGSCVRVGNSDAGVLAHVKVATFPGDISTATTARVVATGSSVTLSAAPGPWSPMVQGPSFDVLMRLLVAFPFLTGLWVNTWMVPCPDWHAGFAAAWLADARANGKKIGVERHNECWNLPWPFARGNAYINAQGTAAGMPGPNPWERGAQWNLWRATIEWPEWETRFATAGRSADIYRVVCWQNANGNSYWHDYATILNPESAVNGAGLVRTVVPIDILGSGPYFANLQGWTASQMLAATTQDLDDELNASITTYNDTPGESMQFWIAAAAARAATQGGRVCGYFAYEIGQHSVPSGLSGFFAQSQANQDAIVAKMVAFQNSANMTRGYQRVLGLLRAANVPACWFDDTQTWGVGGFFGHTQTPYNPDGTVNLTDPRFVVLLRQASYVHQRTGPDCDVRVLAAPGTWQRFDRAALGASWSVTVNKAAGTATVLSLTTHLRFGSKWEATVNKAGGFWQADIPIGLTRAGAGRVIRVTMAPGDGTVLGEVTDRAGASIFGAVCVAPGVWSRFEEHIYTVQGVKHDIMVTLSGSGVLVPIAGTLTGPRRAHGWRHFSERRFPKPRTVTIHRGSLLSWSSVPLADAAGDLVRMVIPLRLGEQFAGMATDTALAGEDYVEVSLRGDLFADVADLEPGDADVVVVATDDQQVSKQATSTVVGAVVIGRGYYDPGQVPLIAYEAVEARSADEPTDRLSDPLDIIPPVAPV